ncbi:MAG: discoidin domain-containing protein [Spirochaetales bacterium]|nr:discoidin domain-containing protein [Spirochaetales bacterium]
MTNTTKRRFTIQFKYFLTIVFLFFTIGPLIFGQTVTVDPMVQYQQFEGWGASICWWGNQIGRWSESNRNNLVEYVINPETGLGYNIFRFNIGGGENPSHHHMTEFRDMPGYQPSPGVWDWEADKYQRAVLLRLIQRAEALGQNLVLEAFSNSPPYWMTNSACASGASSPGNNLSPGNYQAFADYLTEVVRYYRDTWGIVFNTLEPLNEPSASWWVEGNTQEGCSFTSSSQSALLEIMGKTLVSKGLSETRLSAPDETSIDTTITTVKSYSQAALSYISQINSHSYSGSKRGDLKNLAANLGKRLWQSESGPLGWPGGDDNDVAIYMAKRIITDLREMQPVAWLDWQIVDGGVWGSIHVNQSTQSFTFTKRFYMHRNFSQFIRPGARFIDINHSNMIAAISQKQDYLTIVVLNEKSSSSENYTIDLSAFSTTTNSVSVHRTSKNENLFQLANLPISGKRFTASVPAYSISTYQIAIDGSTIPSPTPAPGPNIALKKAANVDSEESENPAANGNDGDLTTRWCANNGNTGHWWKVDLGDIYNLSGSEVFWEGTGHVYKYLIEVSSNNSSWTTVADQRNNSLASQTQVDLFSTQARYIRITVTGLDPNMWASFYEFRVFGAETITPTPTPTPEPAELGDVNQDNWVNIVDSLLIAQFYVGLHPDSFIQELADVNCSGSVDIVDALLVAQLYINLITQFPCK